MTSENGKLFVQTMGGFHLFWNGQEVNLKFSSYTKVAQILQFLLYHAPEKVTSSMFISNIFSDDNILNPNNNLKASVSLLRKNLSASCLPEDSYIIFQNDGYVWNGGLAPVVDVHVFEEAVRKANAEQDKIGKIALYKSALSLYTGEFLPELPGLGWAVPIGLYYANLYSDTMHKLIEILWNDEAYEAVLSLADEAYAHQRSEEWQISKMQCLMKLSRWDEAKKTYMDVVNTMTREYDVMPSEELLEQYRLISSQISNELGDFHDMLDDITEQENLGGAYCCAFPGFVDSCRIVARTMTRSGESCFLMLCSLCDSAGKLLRSGERLQDASQKLRDAIQNSLRHSDFFTQYNPSQYLAFLVGTSFEHCSIVQMRIENNFRALSVRGIRLQFDVQSAATVDSAGFVGDGGEWV